MLINLLKFLFYIASDRFNEVFCYNKKGERNTGEISQESRIAFKRTVVSGVKMEMFHVKHLHSLIL